MGLGRVHHIRYLTYTIMEDHMKDIMEEVNKAHILRIFGRNKGRKLIKKYESADAVMRAIWKKAVLDTFEEMDKKHE